MERQTVYKRIQKNAKNLRLISRQEIFDKYRKMQNQLSYLNIYPSEVKNAILQSIQNPVPSELPLLSTSTISYYRRSSQPIFQMKNQKADNFYDPHMTYQSLWILAALEQSCYPNYGLVVEEFQKNLDIYIGSEFPQIRQMAVIVAGNKIIGKPNSILRIVQQDKKQIWVLTNHIYERKISFTKLYPFVEDNNQIIFRTIFELSNYKQDQILSSIMDNDNEIVLEKIVQCVNSSNNEVKKYCIYIVGNLLAEKAQYAQILFNYKILDKFFTLLNSSDLTVRKDVCWAISNFAYQKQPANLILCNQKLFQKLLERFLTESNNQIRLQLCHIFIHLLVYGNKIQMFRIIMEPNILYRLSDFLSAEHIELNKYTLYLIQQTIKLGQNFLENDKNILKIKLHQIGLFVKIRQKSFSKDKEISQISTQIEGELEQQEE